MLELDSEPLIDAATFVPEQRERNAIATRGTVILIRGQFWVFVDYVPEPGRVWDEIYDANLIKGQYEPGHLMMAAIRLLWPNYDLTPEEAAAVITAANLADLVTVVERAMFGPSEIHRTWSDWVVASLASVGLRHEDIPPAQLKNVMDMLVKTGRILPASKFISSAEYAAIMG